MGKVGKAIGSVAKGVGSFIGIGAGGEAADAAGDAANLQAQYQKEALDYLKEREALPQQFREGALTQLAGLAGLEGGEGDQQALIERAMQSPLYKQLMGGRKFGEDAIMRTMGTGGNLRSGNLKDSIFTYDTQLQNDALLQAYNQQLQGLAGLGQLPSMAQEIANQTSNIGTTLAQGEIAQANARQSGDSNLFGNVLGLGNLGVAAFGSGMFSDRRLKKNLEYVGKVKGFDWYVWDWNKIAEKLGLSGKGQGVMADEVFDSHPHAVGLKDNFLFVNYHHLGVM